MVQGTADRRHGGAKLDERHADYVIMYARESTESETAWTSYRH